MKKRESQFKRVLITRFSALGDVAMSIPVIYSVCMANPDTQFYMVTQKIAADLFINPPKNLTVKGIKVSDYKGMWGIYRLYRELKKEFHPDAFVDLHGVLRTHLLTTYFRLSGIKVKKIDKGRAGKRALTREYNKRLLPLISSRARYREVFHRLGFDFDYLFESIFNGKSAKSSDFSDIITTPKDNNIWIAIAPFAKHNGKIYPLEKMEMVISTLSKRCDYKIFLLGSGEKEKELFNKWENSYPNVISLAKKRYGFYKELALLSNCNAMISMDSANMHLASLVSLPVVSVWGATHPYCGFLGWRQSEENAVQLSLACRPCSVFGNKPCKRGDYYCLTGISPQLIINILDRVLEKEKK